MKNQEIIYKTVVGSRSHGLHVEGISDFDYRYIFKPSLKSILSPFKNQERKIENKNDEDVESWSIASFCEHLCKGNPTMYEVIKSPLYDKNLEHSEQIRKMMPLSLDSRKILMAHAGYIEAQLKRYLRKASHDFKDYQYKMYYDPNMPLLGIPKYEMKQYTGYSQLEIDGVWELNHLRRVPKSCCAGYRIFSQCMQLLETGDFCPVISDYSPELHDELMEIKLMDPSTITCGFIQTHLDELEQKIKDLHKFFDSLPESKRNMKPNISKIEDILCEIYGIS